MAWTPATAVFAGCVLVFLTRLSPHSPCGVLRLPARGSCRCRPLAETASTSALLGTGLILIIVLAMTSLALTVGLAIAAVWAVVVLGWG